MASAAVAAAGETAAIATRRNFRVGGKQVYLPNQVITLLRPKAHMPPEQASFIVPLTFNKLDLRDYLWHVYAVRVNSVRSFINQQAPEQKRAGRGQMYRPRSVKMMIAVMDKPFVWPAPSEGPAAGRSAEEDPFAKPVFDAMAEFREKQYRELEESRRDGALPLPSLEPTGRPRRELARQARALLSGHQRWENKADLDERWAEIEKEEHLGKGR